MEMLLEIIIASTIVTILRRYLTICYHGAIFRPPGQHLTEFLVTSLWYAVSILRSSQSAATIHAHLSIYQHQQSEDVPSGWWHVKHASPGGLVVVKYIGPFHQEGICRMENVEL